VALVEPAGEFLEKRFPFTGICFIKMSISPPAFEVTFSFFSFLLVLFFSFKKGQKEVKKERVFLQATPLV